MVAGTVANGVGGGTSFNGDYSLALPALALGAVCLVVAYSGIAADKGHSRSWGVVGLVGLLGLAVVCLLRDRNRGLIDGWPEDQSAYAGYLRADPWNTGRLGPGHLAPGPLNPAPQHQAG